MSGNRLEWSQGLLTITADTTVDDSQYAPSEVWSLPPVAQKTYLVLALETVTGTGRTGIRVTASQTLPGTINTNWAIEYAGYQGSLPNPLLWESVPLETNQVNYLLPNPIPSATYKFRLVARENGKSPNYYPETSISTPVDTVYVDTTTNTGLLNDIADDYVISLQDQSQLRTFLANQKFMYETLYTQIYAKTGSDVFIAGNILGEWRESVWKPCYQYFAALCYAVPGWASDVTGYNGSQTYDSKGSVNLGGTPTNRTTIYNITNMNGYQALKNGLLNTVLGMQKDYNALPATTSYVGMVKPDGTTITINASGVISSTGGSGSGTQITAIAPILGGVITGSGSLSMNKASHTSDGYLSSGDWDNFTGKTSNLGTVTNVSFVQNNGFYAEITNPTSTPSMTLHTDITGILKGDGYGMSAATAADLANKIGYTGYFQPVFGTSSNGFIKISTGNVITYDNNTYSQTNHNHSGTYQPILSGNGFVTINGSVIGYDLSTYYRSDAINSILSSHDFKNEYSSTTTDTQNYCHLYQNGNTKTSNTDFRVYKNGVGYRTVTFSGDSVSFNGLTSVSLSSGDISTQSAFKTGTGLNTTSTSAACYTATSNASDFIGLNIKQSTTGKANIKLETNAQSGRITLSEIGIPITGTTSTPAAGSILFMSGDGTNCNMSIAPTDGAVYIRGTLRPHGPVQIKDICDFSTTNIHTIGGYNFFSGNGGGYNYIFSGTNSLGFKSNTGADVASMRNDGMFIAKGFVIKDTGLASQFLKGDGSVDTNTYVTSSNAMANRGSVALADIDTAISNGFYTVARTGDSISLLNFNAGGSTGPLQIQFDYSGNITYRNKTDSTTWTGWKSLITTANVASYAGSTINGTGFVKASGTTITYDNSTYYPTSNPSGYTNNTGTVTSVSGTGSVSGLTLSGSVTGSGSLTLGGSLSLSGHNISELTNNSGYITGITSGNVTTALGFTPYNATNPSGYITAAGTAANSNAFGTYTADLQTVIGTGDYLLVRNQGSTKISLASPTSIASMISGQSMNINGNSTSCSGTSTYATNLSNSGDVGYIGTLHCSNWIRTSGTSGWYNETYNTGMHSDASGNVKTYNGGSLEATGNGTSGGMILRDERGYRYRIYVQTGILKMIQV